MIRLTKYKIARYEEKLMKKLLALFILVYVICTRYTGVTLVTSQVGVCIYVIGALYTRATGITQKVSVRIGVICAGG